MLGAKAALLSLLALLGLLFVGVWYQSERRASKRAADEALVRYALRPPIAQERLKLLPGDLVRIELKRPFSDGDAEEWLENHTVAIDLDPLSLLCRLAASVPPPIEPGDCL